MKHYVLIFICCFTVGLRTYAEAPQVPSSMRFAGMRLQITRGAQALIQEKVDSLTRNEKCFQELLDRVNLFLPIVERILREEGVPEDFKYQVIQESGMVSDAVHASCTVGFWQFKDYTASEVGLKMDHWVDERMHIAASTRGAAKYLKSNNQYLDNWLHTLLAYNRGRGYVEENINCKKYRGATQMKIDGQTHWYIIHFLAHKLVFEKKVGKEQHPELYLHEYKEVHGKTLHEIAQEFKIDQQQVKTYNKWLKRHRVPTDTNCVAIIPMTHQQWAQRKKAKRSVEKQYHIDYAQYWKRAVEFPVIIVTEDKKQGTKATKINDLAGVVAQKGDSLSSLAQKGNIDLAQFLALNDLKKEHVVVPGQVYYYQSKWSKAGVHFHIARPQETWWSVAQKYGIKKQELLCKNRLRTEVGLTPGRVLWLRFIRPAKIPVAYEPIADE